MIFCLIELINLLIFFCFLIDSKKSKKIVKKQKPKKQKPKQETVAKKDSKDTLVPASSGTGFFVSNNGHIVTNDHVIVGCRNVTIAQEGKYVEVDVIAYDEKNDLSLFLNTKSSYLINKNLFLLNCYLQSLSVKPAPAAPSFKLSVSSTNVSSASL